MTEVEQRVAVLESQHTDIRGDVHEIKDSMMRVEGKVDNALLQRVPQSMAWTVAFISAVGAGAIGTLVGLAVS